MAETVEKYINGSVGAFGGNLRCTASLAPSPHVLLFKSLSSPLSLPPAFAPLLVYRNHGSSRYRFEG